MRFSGQLRIFSHAILASVEDIFARDSRVGVCVNFLESKIAKIRIFFLLKE